MNQYRVSLDANDKLIQTRSHVRNTITSRKRRFVMRKGISTILDWGAKWGSRNYTSRVWFLPSNFCATRQSGTHGTCHASHTLDTPLVHTKQKKVRSAVKVLWSSQGWTRTDTGCVMPYCMVIHFLSSCEWRYSCGEEKHLCSSQCWSCANAVSVMCADV